MCVCVCVCVCVCLVLTKFAFCIYSASDPARGMVPCTSILFPLFMKYMQHRIQGRAKYETSCTVPGILLVLRSPTAGWSGRSVCCKGQMKTDEGEGGQIDYEGEHTGHGV